MKILKKYKQFENSTPYTEDDYMMVSADFRDIDTLISEFKEAIEHFGLHFYDDPALEGSDTFGFIISRVELDEIQLNEISGLDDDEYENEDDETDLDNLLSQD